MKDGCILCRWHYFIPHADHNVTWHCIKKPWEANEIDISGDACDDNFEKIPLEEIEEYYGEG